MKGGAVIYFRGLLVFGLASCVLLLGCGDGGPTSPADDAQTDPAVSELPRATTTSTSTTTTTSAPTRDELIEAWIAEQEAASAYSSDVFDCVRAGADGLPDVPTDADLVATGETCAAALSANYDLSTFQIVHWDGWVYDVTPEIGAGWSVAVEKDISQSPPGEARYAVDVASNFEVQPRDANPGRTAPTVRPPEVTAYWVVEGMTEGGGDAPCSTSQVRELNESFKYDAQLAGVIPAGTWVFGCGLGREAGSIADEGDVDFEEPFVDALVAGMTPNESQFPILYLEWNAPGCSVVLAPDGQRHFSQPSLGDLAFGEPLQCGPNTRPDD